MSAIRDPKHLSDLPQIAPPADAWPAIQSAMRKRKRRYVPWLAATAAMLIAGFAGLLMVGRQATAADRELQAWMQYAQSLETAIAQYENRSSVLRGHQGAALAQLKGQLTAIDRALENQTEPKAAARLWAHRVSLLSDILAVRVDGSNPILRRAPVTTLSQPASLVHYEI